MAQTEADIAYSNADFIPGADGYLTRWPAAAQSFRDGVVLKEQGVRYGPGAAQTYDIFHPSRLSKGTVIFVHGGYWLRFGPRDFSHLGKGALDAGFAFATPRYTLAPSARIGDMVREVSQAIGAIAQRTIGPLYLAGHSAGGHLVARAACADVAGDWFGRVSRVLPISPISDLAPLLATTMNETLQIDQNEARDESPIHHPAPDVPVTVWVGADERPVFLDQMSWLAAAWRCDYVVDPDRHHFDVIAGLEDARSEMMQTLLS